MTEPSTMPRILYTPAEVAEMCGYTRRGIVSMCAEGHLDAVRIGGRGDYRIPARIVEQLRDGTYRVP